MVTLKRLVACTLVVLLAGSTARAQSLPAPINSNLDYFGYYKGHTVGPSPNGNYVSYLRDFTNLYIADASEYYNDTYGCEEGWLTPFLDDLYTATSHAQAVLLLGGDTQSSCGTLPASDIIAAAADYWSYVVMVKVKDDVGSDATEGDVHDWVQAVKDDIDGASLPSYPLFLVEFNLDGARNASGVSSAEYDVLGCEFYSFGLLDPPGTSDGDAVIRDLNFYITGVKARARTAGKWAVLTAQGYDLNYPNQWAYPATLALMQDPIYMSAYADPIVIGITVYAYSRSGGTVDYPAVEAHHHYIAAALGLDSVGTWSTTPVDMAPNAAIANCDYATVVGPSTESTTADCLSYCNYWGAYACEWNSSNHYCYAKFDEGCWVDYSEAHSGWYALALQGQTCPAAGVGCGPEP
jgi:hypothetical protein